MVCPECNSEIEDGIPFGFLKCAECGSRLINLVTGLHSRPLPSYSRVEVVVEKRIGNKIFLSDKEINELGYNQDSFGNPVKRDPTKNYCSFCHVEVPENQVTFGRGNPIEIVETLIDESVDPPTLKERKRVYSKHLTACPKCCLNLKPIVDRKTGKIKQQGVKFPEFD